MSYTIAQEVMLSTNGFLKPISVETMVREKNRHNKNPETVEYNIEGPIDPDYGRLFLEKIIRIKRGSKNVFVVMGESAGNDGRYHVGDFPKMTLAMEALAEYATAFHRPASLEQEFENKTKGGFPIVFMRRVSSGIVALAPGFTTSWDHDGKINLYSDDPEKADSYALVRKPGFVSKYPGVNPPGE